MRATSIPLRYSQSLEAGLGHGLVSPQDSRFNTTTTETDAATAPPVHRGSMTPVPWVGFWRSIGLGLKDLFSRKQGLDAQGLEPQEPWQRAARNRRRVFVLLIALSTLSTTLLFTNAQWHMGVPGLHWAQVMQITLFALLSAWVTSGFVTALMGVWVMLRGDAHALSAKAVRSHAMNADARTAVIMPICHEDVNTVFAGLRATCESIASTARTQGFKASQFDVFVLSDSSKPDVLAAERAAWEELRAVLADMKLPQVEVYYRARTRRHHRKAGNVADFCRRWGKDYRYMIVLDADSVMSGDTLASLVKLMEAHPKAGIIQTAPQAVGHVTLHARAQQFASRVTGRIFTLGMQFWQLGESHYWGHNAILRIEPFMQHCALAPIGGRAAKQGGLQGPILSHDFVEAALMCRAGWQVWLASDLTGSYEQQPPDLLAELQRDRRWCQGNLQNAQLIAEPGLRPVHRAMFLTGAASYLASPLWMAFITLGVVLWVSGLTTVNTAFSAINMDSSSEIPGELVGLWVWTLTLLFLPRVLGLAAVLMKREQHLYGGAASLLKSAVLEAGLALLQAPIRMAAHTLFVLTALTGIKLEWKSPPREAAALPWGQTLQQFMPMTALFVTAIAVGLLLAWAITPAHAALIAMSFDDSLSLLPVAVPLLLATPLAVGTSLTGLGAFMRRRRWLLIPEESWSPAVLRRAWKHAAA